ncbi:AAA family ATPase [Candidatus Cyanaurora vandensis]|uniref:AAA family ATPase n=1 Tax=Candidatus Cyanaurora vandensis TaxID=2714958 RepID=UPI00257ABB0E|nr:AAA family ATPase [Candidatus Cyanaurora vandensis]
MVQSSEELLARIQSNFEPQPLPAGDPLYVDCTEVRGDVDICLEFRRSITRATKTQCRLYTGHRGAGKSTELLRLCKKFEDEEFFVVYFNADDADLNTEDTEYSDILLACTRHLLEELEDYANPNPVIDWLKSRWTALQDLGLSEVELDKMGAEVSISTFAKLTASVRQVPNVRQKIRQEVDNHTPTLIQVLNEYVGEAREKLSNKFKGIVMVVDSLDRIVPIFDVETSRSNHDRIFLDRHEQLKALACHVVYTIPISMVQSDRATSLFNCYSFPNILPMVMVKTRDGKPYPSGIAKMKEVIEKRVQKADRALSLDKLFEESEDLERLCSISGGHVRDLIFMMQEVINGTENLPIGSKAVNRAIAKLRDLYRLNVNDGEWIFLAKVHLCKMMPNTNEHRKLLLSRCILEYKPGENDPVWYDVHPTILSLPEFEEALTRAKPKEL